MNDPILQNLNRNLCFFSGLDSSNVGFYSQPIFPLYLKIIGGGWGGV